MFKVNMAATVARRVWTESNKTHSAFASGGREGPTPHCFVVLRDSTTLSGRTPIRVAQGGRRGSRLTPGGRQHSNLDIDARRQAQPLVQGLDGFTGGLQNVNKALVGADL